ncbi:unnamed protein product [Schistosoma margrebowiei]|uniref:Uncharacterized protein n=1 Tax=Schistosoma margrebowiei TaxID=48269 RepID=A0A183M7T2_9TREM|nr:unnamed protein product [Schistosoma margrebowiei]
MKFQLKEPKSIESIILELEQNHPLMATIPSLECVLYIFSLK